ncbi:cyclic lactone autoinducer peptide [Turicibacter bilis]|uniref:cyclic lactone autoinducer peptide n=1 Tax=Turicibacter bilis TaxID=2735723 RepID=UPI0031BA935D
MKNMKQNLIDDLAQSVAKSLGKIASITGDAATDGVCIGFIYEPKVPKELLVNKALNK